MSPMPEFPARIKRLPLNEQGFPIPWFVAVVDGKADFRLVGEDKLFHALRWNICWICGEPLGAYKAFVIGPMCAINLVSSEPPSHRECAEFSAQACPFLTNPDKDRRAAGLPAETHDPGGIMIPRNPGVALIWITKKFVVEAVSAEEGVNAGLLMRIGYPEEVIWYARGRLATRAEVEESIRTGIDALRISAEKDGAAAVKLFQERTEETMKLLPA